MRIARKSAAIMQIAATSAFGIREHGFPAIRPILLEVVAGLCRNLTVSTYRDAVGGPRPVQAGKDVPLPSKRPFHSIGVPERKDAVPYFPLHGAVGLPQFICIVGATSGILRWLPARSDLDFSPGRPHLDCRPIAGIIAGIVQLDMASRVRNGEFRLRPERPVRIVFMRRDALEMAVTADRHSFSAPSAVKSRQCNVSIRLRRYGNTAACQKGNREC